MQKLRVGMGQPYAVRATVLASADFAPASVTGATMKVTRPDNSTVDWVCSLSGQSTAGVTAVYALASSGNDLQVVGVWRVWIQWTVVGQTPGPRSEVASFEVIAAAQ